MVKYVLLRTLRPGENTTIPQHFPTSPQMRQKNLTTIPQQNFIFPLFRSKTFILPQFRSKIFIFPLFRSKKNIFPQFRSKSQYS
jgi:hypothetical protein